MLPGIRRLGLFHWDLHLKEPAMSGHCEQLMDEKIFGT
jgi:hypothetical protein